MISSSRGYYLADWELIETSSSATQEIYSVGGGSAEGAEVGLLDDFWLALVAKIDTFSPSSSSPSSSSRSLPFHYSNTRANAQPPFRSPFDRADEPPTDNH